MLGVLLSIDLENGYSDDPTTVANNVMRLIDLGVACISIEDGTDSPMVLALKNEAIRDALARRREDLFINARSDVILAELVDPTILI